MNISCCFTAIGNPHASPPGGLDIASSPEVRAAMVAGVGAGVFSDFSAASVAVQLDPNTIDPDAATQQQYADAYGRYRAAFDAVEKALAP